MRRNLVYGFRYDHNLSANADNSENAVLKQRVILCHTVGPGLKQAAIAICLQKIFCNLFRLNKPCAKHIPFINFLLLTDAFGISGRTVIEILVNREL
jgi:hypothetical protein